MLCCETDRLHYLAALGITQYRARQPLPLALPSTEYQHIDLALWQTQRTPTTTAATTPTAKPASQPAATAISGTAPRLASIALDNDRPATPKVVTEPEHTPATPPLGNSEPVFQCQLALWPLDDMLLIADIQRLDNPQVQLLRNILSALKRTAALPAPQQFSWPMAKRRDQGFGSAREHFLGMLDAGVLKRQELQQLLCFGAQSGLLLTEDHTLYQALTDSELPTAELLTKLSAVNSAHDWPTTVLPSLEQMLRAPARYKPLAWQLLQNRILR